MKFPWQKSEADQSNLPKEIQSYYSNNQPRRNGTAWLLAIATLIGTVLVLAGLFFAGRWIVQQLSNNDEANTSQGTPAEPNNQPAPAEPETGDSQPSTPTPDVTPTPTPAPQDQPAPAPTPPQTIINTGPNE